MSLDARAHVFYKIANAPVLAYPYPHFYIESVFPDEYYGQLLAALPPAARYTPLGETGSVTPGAYPERFIFDPAELTKCDPPDASARFWKSLLEWMEGGEFSRLLLGKFDRFVIENFGIGNEFRIDQDTRLIRDFTNYAIAPHTDTPRKLVSLLFYLPRDDSMRHLGTSIFEPLDPEFTCDGTKHHRFADFRKMFTAPFRPNTLFAFFRTDRSFHGVEPIADTNIERDLLLYNIYVNKIVRMTPPRKGFRWPWSRK
jgi:hypothetical protein